MGGSLLLYLHSVLFAHTYLDLLLGSLHDFNDFDLKASLKPMSMCRPGPSHGPLHHPRLSICSGFFAAAPWLMVVVMMMVTMALLLLMVVLTVLLMVSNIMVIYGHYTEKLNTNSARDVFPAFVFDPLAFGCIWYFIMSLLL